jgi:SNF2 family DNA or RNA helicase
MKPFPFQQEAVDKFAPLSNVLLGDDMGTGKTVTAILLDRKRRETQYSAAQAVWLFGRSHERSAKPTLVVTLKSVLGSWAEHFHDWAPELKVKLIDPKNRADFMAAVANQSYDVYICHWEALRLEPNLNTVRWLHIIGDEVHAIKNRSSQVTQAFKKVQALYKTGMSGTWADNRPDDAWSVLNWLYGKKWGSYNRFVAHHLIIKFHSFDSCLLSEDCPGHSPNSRPYRETIGVAHADELQRAISPFYLRRRKQDVLHDLPDKYYTTIGVDLSPRQRRAYDGMRRNMLAWIGENEGNPIAAPVVVAQLVRLQQFAVAYGELVPYKKKKIDPDTGEIWYQEGEALQLTDPSAKLDALEEMILADPTVKRVVFGQSKQAIKMLAARMEAKKIGCCLLTGEQTAAQRTELVSRFQNTAVPIFAGTIKAGGVGLTLTAASQVIFLDRDWSPSKNQQAEDRLWRFGQKNAVQVIDLVARDTLDSGRNQKIQLKWKWLRQILGDK